MSACKTRAQIPRKKNTSRTLIGTFIHESRCDFLYHMRTSVSSSHTAAPRAIPPFEVTVSLVAQDAAASVLRTVQRARHKPMGRFRKWTIEHTNTRCDVVRAIRVEGGVTSDVATSIIPGTTFVLDLIGQRVGRLYRARTATSPQDVLHDADAVYDVHDIRRVDSATNGANTQYRLRLAPYTAPRTTPTETKRGASSRSFTTSRPVWGSRLTVFFDTQERLDGRVVWTDDKHIDIQVKDTGLAKVWVRVTPSVGTGTNSDSLNRPSLTEYRLDQVDMPTGVSTWQASQCTLEATIDRLRYRARADDGETGDAEDALALRRHLARAAPRGFSHIVLLQATSDASTVAHVHNDSVEPVHVVQVEGATSATFERTERMDRTMPQAFPWSPTQYIERVLAVRTGSRAHGTEAGKTTMGVPLHLQPAAHVYRSWLQSTKDAMGPAREVDRYHVLLPSAFDLRDQHPLRSCETSALDTVYLDVTGPDARRMVEYVLADEVLGKGLQGKVMHDVKHRTTKRVNDRVSTKPHTSVRILTNAYSSRRMRRVLLGQAIVTLVDKRGNTVQSAGQREEALRHGDSALTRHWGYMGGHWQYDIHALASTNTDSLMWHPSAFHTPVTSEVENDDPTQPLPLMHTTLVPLGNQRTTAPQFQITPTTYWPPRNTYEDYETRGQCLRRIRPKPYARIIHKDVAKQMAGTGFKMLMDIEELRNPGWCNVEIAGEADLVNALHTYTTRDRGSLGASTSVGHVALASHVHTIACDTDGHIGRQYFARFPAADSDDTDAQTMCRSIVSRNVLDATIRAHPATSLLRYGYHADASSNLPPLSHYLYGTHDRPKRGVQEAFQCKPALVRRIVDGYGTRRLIMEGIYSQSRWSRVDVASLTTRPGAGVSDWRLTVDGATPATQTVSLSRKVTSNTTNSVYPLSTLCTAWTRALRKAFPNATFEVRYDEHTQTLGVTSQRPFTVHTGMHEWGVTDNTRAVKRARESHHIVEASVAALCGRGPYALRAQPTYVKPGTASTVRICYEVSTDGSDSDINQGTSDQIVQQETVPVTVVCTPYPGVEPFEAADTARFMTRAGRHVGRSRYTSVPIAGHPLHVGIVLGEKKAHLLLVVRAHHVALVDSTTGIRLHGATLDWSSSVDREISTPTDINVDSRIDATTRHVDMWRVVHRASGEARTVTINNQRIVVTETPPGVSLSEVLCRTYQRTLRGELVHEIRASVDQATGGHRVDVWRLLRHQESTVQTRLQQVVLVSEALAATFVTDPSTGARFVLVAEANATLTLHAVLESSENDGVPVTMSGHPWHRMFPRTLPQSSTLRPHKRLVAMGAVCTNAVSGTQASCMNIALGFDGRAELEWLSLTSGSSASASSQRIRRHMCRPSPVSSLLTGKELTERGWWWRPHVQFSHRSHHAAVQVTLRGPKLATAVTVHDCRLGLAAQMETTLSHWLGAPLDTIDVHYVFSHESLPFGTALMQYLLQTVVGHHRTTPSTTFTRYVHDRATMFGTSLTLDPRAHLRAYYSLQPHDQHTRDNEVVDDPLYKLPCEASKMTQAMSLAYHTSVADALVSSAVTTGRHMSSVSRHSHTSMPMSARRSISSRAPLSTEAKRAVFYAKVQRLLQDHREGVPYVQRVYRQSANFRAQFHDCKGFCYQRLLCRCRVLYRGQGYGTRVEWTAVHRDATTFLTDGEAYHLCQTCGERVCPQDAGLSKDYDAMGMSSTHSENAHDQRLDDDAMAAATDSDANNERKDWTLISHQPIEHLLRRLGLLSHRPKLDALLVSNRVFKLLPGGKAAVPRIVKAPGCTLQTAQRILDASAAGSLVTVYACAADALLLAMDRRNVLGSRVPPVPRSTAKERAVVESFEPQFTFSADELKTGIYPRPYYRPHLTPRVNVNVVPTGANGWPRLDAIVNSIETQLPALLDPSSLNHEPTAFAQRDQYLCVPQDLHQSSRTPYTTLAQLLDPTIRPRAGDTASVPARLEFVRIYPWTRLCNALAPNAHTVLPVSNPYANMPAAHALTASTMPKHPLAWRLHAPPTDVQRRASVAHRLLRYADATHGRFAYPLQVLLDTNLVKPQDPTVLLKWLVGVTTLTRYRITAHPPTDFRMKPAWMLYYEQMEPDNKVAEELVKGMCCRVVNGG